MLMMDGNTYYVEVQDNSGERTRRDVELGDFFDVYTKVKIRNSLKLRTDLPKENV
jgi:hypothetical protein